jgi:hypothetical protein
MKDLINAIIEGYSKVSIVEIVIAIVLPLLIVYLRSIVLKWYKKIILNIQTCRLKNEKPKGLVAVIAVDIDNIESVSLTENTQQGNLTKIFFADEAGEYENRNTFLQEEEIDRQCKIISDYYDTIGKEIEENFKDKKLFYYKNNEKKRIDIMFKEYYSSNEIKKTINAVNAEMKSNNAIHFIGDKIGLKNFDIKNKSLSIYAYKTDHFTWQVFKEIFKKNKPFFQDIVLRINKANLKEKQVLVRLLAFLFSSIGIDIVIEGKDCNKKRKMIITARSGNIEKDKKSSLHVSVNETFSRTDYFSGHQGERYSLYSCVKRGIEEEIGIPEEYIKDKYIEFHDFAIVTDEGEIGLSCHVNLEELLAVRDLPVERMLMYPGQDKYLEIEELLIIPYLKINHISLLKSMKSKKFMHSFYRQTMNDYFNLPWQSFTPLLISRCLIRGIKYNWLGVSIYYILMCVLVITVLWKYNFLPNIFNAIIAVATIAAGELLLFAINKIKNNKGSKYKNMQSFVSQWHGNTKVIQATGYIPIDLIYKGIAFSINNKLSNITALSFEHLYLNQPPYCSVRIKNGEKDFAEKPISLFLFEERKNYHQGGYLKFRQLDIYFDSSNVLVFIHFEIENDEFTKKKKIKSISFSQNTTAELQENEKKESFTSDDLEMYKSFFKMTEEQSDVIKKSTSAKLSNNFVCTQKPQDLLYSPIDKNYYWSCVNNGVRPIADVKYELKQSKKKSKQSLYDFVIQKIENTDRATITIEVQGKKTIMEQLLNNFIQHPANKRRISELDLYMIQLYCIRKDLFIADVDYKKKENFLIVQKTE